MHKIMINLDDYSQIQREIIKNISKLYDHDQDIAKTKTTEDPIWKPKVSEDM